MGLRKKVSSMNKQDPANLNLICYPDPRLRKKSAPAKEFDSWLARVARRMFEVMYTSRGVGLAAPQVGLNLRLFVCNEAGKSGEGRELAFVNPVLDDLRGAAEGEEGCLSLPGVNGQILRATHCRIKAYDLAGNPVEMTGDDLLARIWQHETDHLDGVLLMDRFDEASRIANRRAVKELETDYGTLKPKKRTLAK